jgi:hypothetical protein
MLLNINRYRLRVMHVSFFNDMSLMHLRKDILCLLVAFPGNFFGGGVSTNSVEDRGQKERGFGGGSALVRGSAQFANSEPSIIRLLRMYFSRNWEFGSVLSKLRNFGGYLNTPTPLGTPLVPIVE